MAKPRKTSKPTREEIARNIWTSRANVEIQKIDIHATIDGKQLVLSLDPTSAVSVLAKEWDRLDVHGLRRVEKLRMVAVVFMNQAVSGIKTDMARKM